MFKLNKSLILFSFLLIGILLISSCDGRKGKVNVNTPPVITITDYFGSDSLTGVGDPNLFQQTIRWSAYDTDGVIYGYAFRVIDENGNPFQDIHGNIVGTPGYSCVNDSGWVYHYLPGADESIPLEDPDASKTIWTSQVYAVINFPANVNGDSANVVSMFEVKCIDNIGDESIPAKKYFNAESNIPTVKAQSTKGDVDGEMIGLGIVFEFVIQGDEPFIGEIADYYEFVLEKKDLNGNLIPYDGTPQGGYDLDINDPDDWISTKGQDDVSHFTMTKFTTPALIPNTVFGNVPADSTCLTVKAIDIAGIISEPVEISFVIKEGFYPRTIIYYGEAVSPTGVSISGACNDIRALGRNHFATDMDQSIPKVIPSIMTSEGAHFATPFWVDQEGKFTLIGSHDLRVYMHWGWSGEFEGNPQNPYGRRVGQVNDELTYKPYFSEIKFFDLRLDGEPYHYGPLPFEDFGYLDEETGKEWLRVPISNDIAQTTILTGLDTGTHRFEVRAIDLQDVADKTPSEFIFEIVDAIPAEEKEGILVIDSESGTQTNQDSIDVKYEYFLSDQSNVNYIKRADVKAFIGSLNLTQLHFAKSVFSPTDLQQYKVIIYHSDSPRKNNASNFEMEYDSINLYLLGGGNIIFSGGANIQSIQEKCNKDGTPLLQKYFGIPLQSENYDNVVEILSESLYEYNPFFNKAYADNGFTYDIDLELPSSVNNYINFNHLYGLNAVSFFNEFEEGTQIIFTLGCKEIGDGLYDPSQTEYDYYNGQPVAVKRDNNGSKCYLFGFPLSYMDTEQVRTTLNQIIEEIETGQ